MQVTWTRYDIKSGTQLWQEDGEKMMIGYRAGSEEHGYFLVSLVDGGILTPNMDLDALAKKLTEDKFAPAAVWDAFPPLGDMARNKVDRKQLSILKAREAEFHNLAGRPPGDPDGEEIT